MDNLVRVFVLFIQLLSRLYLSSSAMTMNCLSTGTKYTSTTYMAWREMLLVSYGYKYASGQDCTYTFRTALSGADVYLDLYFRSGASYYGIDGSPESCTKDYLDIFDGTTTANKIGRFCGTVVPFRIRRQNAITMRFVSNSDERSGVGFRVFYRMMRYTNTVGTKGSSCSTVKTMSLSSIYRDFSNNGFPNGYTKGQKCTMKFNVGKGHKLRLYFVTVKFDGSSSSCRTYLRIAGTDSSTTSYSNAKYIKKICGSHSKPFMVETSYDYVYLHFDASNAIYLSSTFSNYPGFQGGYMVVDEPEKKSTIGRIISGVVIAFLIVIIIVAVVIYFLCKKKKKVGMVLALGTQQQHPPPPPPPYSHQPPRLRKNSSSSSSEDDDQETAERKRRKKAAKMAAKSGNPPPYNPHVPPQPPPGQNVLYTNGNQYPPQAQYPGPTPVGGQYPPQSLTVSPYPPQGPPLMAGGQPGYPPQTVQQQGYPPPPSPAPPMYSTYPPPVV